MKKEKYNVLMPTDLSVILDSLWTHERKDGTTHTGRLPNKERWIVLAVAALTMIELNESEFDYYVEQLGLADRRNAMPELIELAKSGRLREEAGKPIARRATTLLSAPTHAQREEMARQALAAQVKKNAEAAKNQKSDVKPELPKRKTS